MTQQGQPGTQPLGANNNSADSMPLSQDSQQTSSALQYAQSKHIKVWEGNLAGQRQGVPEFITTLEGYRSFSAAENLAANWPPTMQIVRLISQDHMNNNQYVGKADFLVFRALNQHGFLAQLQEKKLCAVIQLPSQTLLLSIADKVFRLIGMLFPGDMVVFNPLIPSQQQQLQQQMQSQHHLRLQQQQQQLLSQLQQQQQQQLTQLAQQLNQMPQQQPMGNLQGGVNVGQSLPGMSQGNFSVGQIVQSGISVNQNMMVGLRPSGVSSGTDMMIPTPVMTQQGQPGTQPLGANNDSAVSMPLSQDSQQTSSALQSTQSKYIKVWEGNLSGQRQGQPVFITRIEGYRSFSAAENLAANWPPTMQIVRLISQDHMNYEQYVKNADFLVFRALMQHEFLAQLQEKKLCAIIQLPSQTLLLSVSDKAFRLIGMLFPGDMVVFKRQIPNQQQQLQQQHPQLQQQQLQQLQQQQQQQLSQLQQQLTQMPQHLNQMPQQQQQPLHQLLESTDLSLLSRKSHQYTTGETKMWDIGGDASYSMDGAGILELANLSLDEPEMEGDLFTENVSR